jgi:hypothetical protein
VLDCSFEPDDVRAVLLVLTQPPLLVVVVTNANVEDVAEDWLLTRELAAGLLIELASSYPALLLLLLPDPVVLEDANDKNSAARPSKPHVYVVSREGKRRGT